MKKLEDDIASISSTVESMAGTITTKIVRSLQSDNGVITRQTKRIDTLQSTIESLAKDVKKLLEQEASPPQSHKKPKRATKGKTITDTIMEEEDDISDSDDGGSQQ